jgi:hypothetical protein
MQRQYGWRGYIKDHRDDNFLMSMPKDIKIPEFVDNSQNASRVEDQKRTNSCVGHAVSTMMEFRTRRIGEEFVELSPAFPYWVARELAGLEKHDQGCYIRDALKGLRKRGIPQLMYCPLSEETINEKPSQMAFDDALMRTISSFHPLPTLPHMLYAISERLPVVFGASLFKSFESNEVTSTGMILHPKGWEKFIGGHALCGDSYDAREGKRWVEGNNSYGEEWGMKGRYRIPFSYFEAGLVADAWAVVV